MSEPLILGIESTCDETGLAFVRGGKLLADVTASSMDQHARYGGIIPEIASRAHLESFLPTLQEAAKQAGVKLADVDAVACAAGPGLVGSLTVGISAAKAISQALGKPLYGINHVIGHLAVARMVHGELPTPFIGLIVSGGHSNLLLVRDLAGDIVELGGTLDDAAGEAFDKVGRLLNTPYPGGPHVDRLAREGDPNAIRFPRGLAAGKDKERHRYDFSFSGLKTAVARYIEGLEQRGEEVRREDICAGFSEAVNDSLTAKAVAAAEDFGCSTIVVGGGFSANSRLRELLQQRADAKGLQVIIPPIRFCTDNGAQIAALGECLVKAQLPPSPIDFGPDSSMSLEQIYMAPQTDDASLPARESATAGTEGDTVAVVSEGGTDANTDAATDVDAAARTAADAAARAAAANTAETRDSKSARLADLYESAQKGYEKVKPALEQAAEQVKTYAEQAADAASPYLEQAAKVAGSYIEMGAEQVKAISVRTGAKLSNLVNKNAAAPQEEPSEQPKQAKETTDTAAEVVAIPPTDLPPLK